MESHRQTLRMNDAAVPTSLPSRFVDLIQTKVPARAEHFMAQLYGEHALRLRDSTALDMRMQGFQLAGLHVARLSYGAPASASMTRSHPGWVFSFLESGRVARMAGGRVFGPGEASILAPDRLHELEMSADMQLLNLRVSDADMRQACTDLAGGERMADFRFVDAVPSGHAAGLALCRAVRALAELPSYGAGAERLERSLKECVLFELLVAWPNSWSTSLADGEALPRSARRARDYMHAHLADQPTLSELARVAGVSVRALTRSFERHVGVPPMRYMNRLRLDRVHLELQQAEARSVTEVAMRWGFGHMGSFAAAYRERFGVHPSFTFKRR
jgi:AraC-like DNA-binding protein